ncbi:MAG: hypothetical protein OHK0053_14290 [Microscillaceae bacterium]
MGQSKESKAYDKILRENVGEFFLSISQKFLGFAIVQAEALPDELPTTLEHEADFLRRVLTEDGQSFILHIEFQTQDSEEMIYRMQAYFALLQVRYKIPIRSFVIYLGAKPSRMRNQLAESETFRGFELISLRNLEAERFLVSDIPEEIMLALLGDFGPKKSQEILRKIINRPKELSPDPLTLQKYIRQVLTLARLRNLQDLTHKTLQHMALTYNIENDTLYQKGL